MSYRPVDFPIAMYYDAILQLNLFHFTKYWKDFLWDFLIHLFLSPKLSKLIVFIVIMVILYFKFIFK